MPGRGVRYQEVCKDLWDQVDIEVAIHRYRQLGLSFGQSLMNVLLDITLGKVPDTWDNDRPSWLKGLELDRFYKTLKLAFEFQGEQHYTNPDQRKRDQEKAALCKKHGVALRHLNASDLDPSLFAVKLRGYLQGTNASRDSHQLATLRQFVTPQAYNYLKELVRDYRITLQRSFGNRSASVGNARMGGSR